MNRTPSAAICAAGNSGRPSGWLARAIVGFATILAGGCGLSESADDRAAALWVISRGGGVSHTENDLVIDEVARLPEEPFRIDVVDLNNRRIDEANLAKLVPLAELKVLNLYDAGISDAGLVHVAQIASLEELEISYNAVTDEGLQRLAVLPNLKTVFARGTGVTPEGAESLRAGLPNVTVHLR